MADKIHYHLIGIGGVGMSGIAHVLNGRGESVSGSDRVENDITRRLRAAGVKIHIGHSKDNLNGADVVVYSAAISPDNPEMQEARRKGLEMLERPVMLGKLMEPYKYRVAISGTHGKTTTTSMVSTILDSARMDATVLIGGDVKSMGGNARLGKSGIIVTEACEAFGSFLHLYPSIAVLTNLDADHMEYYKTIERIEEAFKQFAQQVDEDGCVVACWDDARVRKVLKNCSRRVLSYGFAEDAYYRAVDVDTSTPEAAYTLNVGGENLGRVQLRIPGNHNVLNSLAAAAVAFELGAKFEQIRDGLAEFRGAGRRFDILYNDGKILVIDDYAHHPAEIAATLQAVNSAYRQELIAVFQPHLYSRTKMFTNEFAQALSVADEVIVTSIYAAREKPTEDVSGENIVEALKSSGHPNARYVEDKVVLAGELSARMGKGEVVLVLGAGDIRSVAEELASILSERSKTQ